MALLTFEGFDFATSTAMADTATNDSFVVGSTPTSTTKSATTPYGIGSSCTWGGLDGCNLQLERIRQH